MGEAVIRVLVATTDPQTAGELTDLVHADPGLLVVALTDATGLPSALRTGDADVCLVECRHDAGALLRILRSPASPCPPVVALTGDHPDARRFAVEHGVSDCLSAPDITASTLSRAIRYVCERRRRQRSEGRLEALIGASREILVMLTPDGRVTYVSPAIQRVLGFAPEETIGGRMQVEAHPDDRAAADESLRQVLAGEPVRQLQYRVRHRDGTWRLLDTILTNHVDDPAIEGIVVSCRDVTDLSLREAQLRLQASLLEAVGQAVIATDTEGRVTFWNRGAERLYGWVAGEALGRDILTLTTPLASRSQGEAILEALRRGESWTGEFEVSRRDGTTFLALVSNSPIHDAEGRLHGVIGTSSDLTATKRTERELRERVKELRTLFAASRMMTSAGARALRERLEALVELLPGGWLEPEITRARIVLHGETVTGPGFAETPWLQSAPIVVAGERVGRVDIALVEARPVRDEGPFSREERELLEAVAGVVGEALLHTQLAQLHARTIASIGEAVIIVDRRAEVRVILDVNPATERMFVRSRAELIGRTTETLHADRESFERFGEESRDALARGGVYQARFRMRRGTGELFEAEQIVTLLRPEQGLDGGAVSIVRDLSQRVRAEASLRESEARFRQIAEHIDHVVWIRDLDAPGLQYVSPAYARIWGRAADPLLADAREWWAHLLPADRDRVVEAVEGHPAEGWWQEYRIARPDGSVRWILDRAFPVRNTAGEVYRLVGVAEDITIRKQLEQRFGALSQEISDVIYVVSPEGLVLLSSPSVEAALGYRTTEFHGMHALDVVHPEDRESIRARFVSVAARPGATTRAQYRAVTKEGAVRHVESVARNLVDDPAVGGILVTMRDVTERMSIEDRIRQAQKLEAVGQLAGGVAHDFNNLLTVIRSQTDLLLMDHAASPIADEVGTIQAAADRGARLTAQLLAFSRDQVLRPEVVGLAAIVRGMDRIIERVVGERVSVSYDVPDDLPPIRVDPGQLEQVIMNLAVNARDAMPQGGTLHLSARAEEVAILTDDTDVPGPAPALCTVLIVQDTGIGMDEKVQRRIFEPFFTTKPKGKGTGLGLAMAYGFVAQSGGTIQVETRPGAGSTFFLTFPAAAPAAVRQDKPPGPEPGHAERLTGSGDILVVEDDPAVRRGTCAILQRAGYRVHAAQDAESALALIRDGQVFDLVLTDLGLPGMTGRELIEHARRIRPSLRLVMMSGYDVSSPNERVELPPDVAFLPKPFTRLALLQAIGRALAIA
jgi:PAS domain S-box-containing protein